MARTAKKREIQIGELKPVVPREQKVFAEKNAAEFLEGRGLVEAEKATAELESLASNKIEQLSSDLFDFIEQQRSSWGRKEPSAASPFNCLASSSIRGDSGCSEAECRTAKLGSMARYAAMYADVLFLPVPLQNPDESGTNGTRQRLIQTVISVLELRPLVERNIVRPTMRLMHYCDEHARLAMSQYREGEDTVAALVARTRNDFEFRYKVVSRDPHIGVLTLRGSEEFIEHGLLYRLYREPPSWAPHQAELDVDQPLSRRSCVHAELVTEVIAGIARDVVFHQQFAPRFDATYLTDLAGEARFLQLLSKDDELAIRTGQLFANLAHEIPLIDDLPVRTILKIRDENLSSFQLYRTSLKKIVKDHLDSGRSTTEAEAHEIYEDILAPALAELRIEAKRQHTKWVRKSLGTAALAVGVVSLGATGVLQSPQVLSLLGGATVKGLVDQLAEANTESVTSNRLYFLLQLQKAAIKRRKSG